MRIRLCCCIVALTLLSCSRPEVDPVPLVGSISFSAEGITHNWEEDDDSTTNDYMPMFIYRMGIHQLSAGYPFWTPYRQILFPINSPTLAVNIPYTYINTDTLPQVYVSIYDSSALNPANVLNYYAYPGDSVTVTITRLHDDRIDGSFSATLSQANVGTKVKITEGTFKNILYKEL